MTKYFVADHHFGHEGIMYYEDRNFKKTSDMNNTMISEHNEVVKDEDEVYFIGDVTMASSENRNWFERIVKKLKGRKILILGNHDRFKPLTYVDMGFESVHTSLLIEIQGIIIAMAHDPSLYTVFQKIPQPHVMVCGHIHSLWTHLMGGQEPKPVINVGVDVWDYKPVPEDRIISLYKHYMINSKEEECI